MELWIRSQNKKALIRADYIEYGEWNKEYRIYINGEVCGKYKSKERTLEVLDEIQNLLKPQMVLSKVGKPIAETCDGTVYREPDEYDIKELSTCVYEMPKD